MAIKAWSQNDFASAISAFAELAGLTPAEAKHADAFVSRKHRQIKRELTSYTSGFSLLFGRSIADQSGYCWLCFETMAREGKLALGLIETGLGSE